jgi:hypothetical protein
VTFIYEIGIFLLAGYDSAGEAPRPGAKTLPIAALALAAISLWGFAQLAMGATVDNYATWEARYGQ